MRAHGHASPVIVACCILACAVGFAEAVEPRVNSLRLPKPENWCIAQKTPLDCDLRDDCVWCEKPGNKFGTGCYPVSAAKLVPKAWGLVCDKDLDPSAAAPTPSQPGSCDGRPEASCVGPACVWCTSAAVGGGCYTPDEAKLLPKAIFKCKTTTTVPTV